MTQGIT